MYKFKVAIVSSVTKDSEFIGEVSLPIIYDPKNLYDQLNKLGGLSYLLDLMNRENDLKIFKNMVTIYVMWQHDLDCLERESLTWNERNSK